MTLLELLRRSTEFLISKKIENAKCDAEWMISSVLNCSRLALYVDGNQKLNEEQEQQFHAMLLRRADREPLQYILGEVEFFGVRLRVDSRVLIPRSETEWLVEWVSKKIGSVLSILDLGTGSGAIAIALAKQFPQSEILAVDRSPQGGWM